MHVAYLINQYPAVSHTFIRREIHALETQGVTVDRFALRGWDSELVDPLDLEELVKTQHTLKDGLVPLLLCAVRFLVQKPARFWAGLKLALSMSRNGARSWPFHLIYLAHACKIIKWLSESQATHLHAHFGTNSAEIAALVKALGGPNYSFTIHGSEVFDVPSHHALPPKVTGAEFVATSCAYIRSQLMYNIPHKLWDKIEVVHCGLAASAFAEKPTPSPKQLSFLSVGRFSPEKGHLILLDAFAKLHAETPGAKLVLAGDGPMRSDIEARITDLGLGNAVRITGWVTSDQVREELRTARALVHPSFTEGLPVVIMEAMAERRPVISTYIAGIPELVCPDKTGWLVPAGQVDDLAETLRACASTSAKEIAVMGDACFERVQSRHDAMKEAAKLKTLFAKGPVP